MYLTAWHHIQEGSHHHSSIVLEMFQLDATAMIEQNECFKSGF
jgi:hypothetical protein